jgi:5-methylcytosine-specific restriction protein A
VRLKLVGVCNNHQLTYEELLKRGLKRPAPLSAMVLKDELLNFVESTFPLISTLKTIVPDDVYDEGSVDNTHKDFYERSRLARRKCIEEKGIRCSICGMSFEETYGPVGKGFIHVHHIKPISEFGEAHKVNPKKDLIPVCPNCHAMLHRKINGHYLSVEELRSLLEKKRS